MMSDERPVSDKHARTGKRDAAATLAWHLALTKKHAPASKNSCLSGKRSGHQETEAKMTLECWCPCIAFKGKSKKQTVVR